MPRVIINALWLLSYFIVTTILWCGYQNYHHFTDVEMEEWDSEIFHTMRKWHVWSEAHSFHPKPHPIVALKPRSTLPSASLLPALLHPAIKLPICSHSWSKPGFRNEATFFYLIITVSSKSQRNLKRQCFWIQISILWG